MTAYHGGKQKIGAKIADEILAESEAIAAGEGFVITGYCEPFCGMLGVYRHSFDRFGADGVRYFAGDDNESVIKMWKAAQRGWEPPMHKVSKREFMALAGNGQSSAVKGYVGHLYGYMGKYFKPFDSTITNSQRVNTSGKIREIGGKLSRVTFSHGSYAQFSKLKGCVIYCDPPYQIQNYYYDESDNKKAFDHGQFWDWCRYMARENIVFVSEYEAPSDFDEVWSKGKERLFVIS